MSALPLLCAFPLTAEVVVAIRDVYGWTSLAQRLRMIEKAVWLSQSDKETTKYKTDL